MIRTNYESQEFYDLFDGYTDPLNEHYEKIDDLSERSELDRVVDEFIAERNAQGGLEERLEDPTRHPWSDLESLREWEELYQRGSDPHNSASELEDLNQIRGWNKP
ncbi:MAG: hypothetical protein U5L00_07225 [Desulfovermiculus sp.]|nr:hypothetical protein [Desulfovermiculus sp.]